MKRNNMLEEIIEFCKIIGKLKRIERTGWVTWKRLNIQNPESVADHVFRSAVLGMLVSDIKNLNTEKVVRMILLHELAEPLMGDWELYAKKKFGEKEFKKKEKEASEKVLSVLPKELKEKYLYIWKEFLEQKSIESKIVKQIDKLEMILQALEYMKEGYDKKALDNFFDFHAHEFTDKDLKKLYDLLDKERRELK